MGDKLLENDAATQILAFVAGVPGTGKSSLCRHLVSAHGFIHYDLERFPAGWPNLALHSAWNASLQANDPSIFVQAVRAAHPGVPVVLDWGFPPRSPFTDFVTRLSQHGLRLVWLGGATAAARRAFLRRGTVPVERFEEQVAAIERVGLPGAIPAFRVVNAFGPDGKHRDPEELVEEVRGLR